MGRTAREQSSTGIYHVMVRGINRQEIFLDQEDCLKFLEVLNKCKHDGEYVVLGYCLMVNHVHLLIKEADDSISVVMKRIGTSYAAWYNKKYRRVGHLFQDRYKSECVEDDKYLLTVVRYIHMNPVKARMVDMPENYRWSSCSAYYARHEYPEALTTTDTVLALFGSSKKYAEESFRQFMEQPTDDSCLEYDSKTRLTDRELQKEIEMLAGGLALSELLGFEREKLYRILRGAKSIPGTSLRQIARVTGIGLNIVVRA
ncbi:MAG: hypothetical protein DDT38_01440 [Firmicutes bacterium]|nr:hypothetical protein [candidate division NPL-UPA2 bacterium]